jgi:cell division protein FtsB
MGPQEDNSNRFIALVVASVITAAWAISFTVDIFVKDYEAPPSVHALMLIVAGAVFGEGLIRSRIPTDKEK